MRIRMLSSKTTPFGFLKEDTVHTVTDGQRDYFTKLIGAGLCVEVDTSPSRGEKSGGGADDDLSGLTVKQLKALPEFEKIEKPASKKGDLVEQIREVRRAEAASE